MKKYIVKYKKLFLGLKKTKFLLKKEGNGLFL